MLVRRLTATAAAALALLVTPFTPASADNVDPVFPEMTIRISYVTGAHRVCWHGELRGLTTPPSPTWRVLIVGVRADTSPIVLDGPSTSVGRSWDDCTTVAKNAAPTGEYVVLFSYDAAGAGQDLTSLLVGGGLWVGAQNNSFDASQ